MKRRVRNWQDMEKAAAELRRVFIDSGKLQNKTSSRAIEIIQKTLNVKTSQAYNVLSFMKDKGWIVTMPGVIQVITPKEAAS